MWQIFYPAESWREPVLNTIDSTFHVPPYCQKCTCWMVPWLRKFHVGFGLLGEQGIESIHAHFNTLGRTYRSMPEEVARLRNLLREHLLHIAPENIVASPWRKSNLNTSTLKANPHHLSSHEHVHVLKTHLFLTCCLAIKKSGHHIWTSELADYLSPLPILA